MRRRSLACLVWIASLPCAIGCDTAIRPEPSVGGGSLAALSNAPVRRLRRLSNREYNNVVRDLLGDTSRPADHFLADVFENGYDNGSVGLAVQSDQVLAYQSAAETLAAAAVAGHLDSLLGGCDPEKRGAPACAGALLSGFAARAYRRPLTPTEKQRLLDLFAAQSQPPGRFQDGIEAMVEVILQSPQFLYREELGPDAAVPVAGGAVHLTNDELASELSFLLTGSIPDAELWSAVRSGRFETDEDHRREAKRLLGTAGAHDTLRAFLHQWLATNRLAFTTKDAAVYPHFSPELAASMKTELDHDYDDALWNGAGSLRYLFTARRSFVDAALGRLYGVSGGGPDFPSVSLDASVRKGVLTRAGFLTVHSDTDGSGPVARGVFVLQSILCAPPPPPPPNVPPPPPASDPGVQNLTTRQRFEKHAASDFCASCHKRIDGIGFGFEEFDGIGAFRSRENGQPVDESGAVVGMDTMDGPYHGASELASRIAGSRRLASCFVRQAYRYGMGDIEPRGDDLEWLQGGFTTDAHMVDVLLNLIGSPVFAIRNFEAP